MKRVKPFSYSDDNNIMTIKSPFLCQTYAWILFAIADIKHI